MLSPLSPRHSVRRTGKIPGGLSYFQDVAHEWYTLERLLSWIRVLVPVSFCSSYKTEVTSYLALYFRRDGASQRLALLGGEATWEILK